MKSCNNCGKPFSNLVGTLCLECSNKEVDKDLEEQSDYPETPPYNCPYTGHTEKDKNCFYPECKCEWFL